MEADYTGDRELSSPMKVRELMTLLQNVDPDFLIVIGADARSLLIVNPHPGFCQPAELGPDGVAHFTKRDRQFLSDLHIK